MHGDRCTILNLARGKAKRVRVDRGRTMAKSPMSGLKAAFCYVAALAAAVLGSAGAGPRPRPTLPSQNGGQGTRVLPSGIHFDIEPHANTIWNTGGADVQASLVAQTVALVTQLDQLWTANGRPMRFVWDMPNWYDTGGVLTLGGVTKSWAQWIIDAGPDQLNLMDFVDSVDGLLSRASWEVQYCASIGKPISLAVETQNVGANAVTFYEEGPEAMQNVLAAVAGSWAAPYASVWRGFEIHDYLSWRNMPPPSNATARYTADRLDAAVYVWQYWLALPGYAVDRAGLWAFLAAQPYTIHRITFESEDLLQNHQRELQAFLDEAAAHGYAVDLAVGAPAMAMTQYHAYVCALMQLAANFYLYGPVSDPFAPPPGEPVPDGNAPSPDDGAGSSHGGGGTGGNELPSPGWTLQTPAPTATETMPAPPTPTVTATVPSTTAAATPAPTTLQATVPPTQIAATVAGPTAVASATASPSPSPTTTTTAVTGTSSAACTSKADYWSWASSAAVGLVVSSAAVFASP